MIIVSWYKIIYYTYKYFQKTKLAIINVTINENGTKYYLMLFILQIV